MIASELTVSPTAAGIRLDRFLSEQLTGFSRSQLQRLIERGEVTVDERSARPAERLKAGQVVRVRVGPPEPTGIVPTAIPLKIVYENPEFVVINKPAGLVVHPAPGHPSDTLANALMARYPNLAVGNAQRPGIVHRLDKGTSGLLVAALTDRAYHHLIDQMKRHLVRKEYLALVHGRVAHERGVIEAPIGRAPENRQKMGVSEKGREARTHFEVVERFPNYTLLRLILETGRTHQIRVHAAAIGHPVVGDVVYGPRTPTVPLERPFLHAYHLGFAFPGGERCLVAWAPLPPELERVLEDLRAEAHLQNSPSTPGAASGTMKEDHMF